jgi:acyl dehydratase
MIQIGETAIRVKTISAEDVSTFANLVEDFNPLHHDAEYAAATRFGGIIASGPHYLSLLMGVLASHYTAHGPQVGIDFQVRFARPVRPGDTIELKWVVTHIEPKSRGSIVTLDGSITNQHGETVLTSVGKIMTFNA